MNKFLKVFTLFTATFFLIVEVAGQSQSPQSIAEEKPLKYDTAFNGIGPKVYIIPPPKTEEELTTEQYLLKKQSQHQIDSLFSKLHLQRKLRSLPVPGFYTDSTINNRYIPLNIEGKILCNEGVKLFLNENLQGAQNSFELALTKVDPVQDSEDYMSIKNNLAVLETQKGNLNKAMDYYQEILKEYLAQKNISQQINTILYIAMLEAKMGNFEKAHQSVINKTMPTLQRIKDYSKIVEALNLLASIKEMQEKYTEAKWIYLQAIDVARTHKNELGLAQSLFNLANLKHQIEDIDLAITDYLLAKEYASKLKMEGLLIEIQDGLGDAYLKLNDFKAANVALDEYLLLKSDLLVKGQQNADHQSL